MNIKSIFIKTIAISAIVATATSCKHDVVKDEPLLAGLVALTMSNLGKGNCAISINNTALNTGAAIAGAVGGGGEAAGLFGGAFTAHYNAVTGKSILNTALTGEPYNVKYDAFFTNLGTWDDAKRASYINTFITTALVGGLGGPTQTQFQGLGAIKGTGLLACARIPRASCSFGGLTTANRSADIDNAVNVYNKVTSTSDCKMSGTTYANLLNNGFRGLSNTTGLNLATGAYTNPVSNADTSTLNKTQVILAEKMYPKFGSLVSLGFGTLMPMKTGTTKYAQSATELTLGSNININQVESCESIGLPSTGFTVAQATPLTSIREIAYSFSTEGSAAAAYAAARGLTVPTYVASEPFEDAKICNNALRAQYKPAVAIGGGKLPSVNGAYGDGGSSLLTACLYGKDATVRGTAATVLSSASTALAGIASCPVAASAGAAKFGDDGLDKLENFPNN